MDAKARVQDWQIIISDWQASGLSGMAFCKANNHAYHKFSYWRKVSTSYGQLAKR